MSRDLGDFQTPIELARAIIERLGPIGARWPRVLEPTCGRGNFIAALLEDSSPPREIVGLELQREHLETARHRLLPQTLFPTTRVELREANIFELSLASDVPWGSNGPLLVLGNPPWVTVAALGAMESDNQPKRKRIAGLAGLDAMTGSSNFDLAEAVWLKVLSELAAEKPTVAMLCKTSVARRLLVWAHDNLLSLESADVFRISGPQWFGAHVDACLLVLEVGESPPETYSARIFASLDAERPAQVMGVVGGKLVADAPAYHRIREVDGTCAITWRQGIKHDAAEVMELLVAETGALVNKLGEAVDIEAEHLFPLVKGGDLARGPARAPNRRLILTQRRLGEDTSGLQVSAPKLWRYLQSHRAHFERRKSSIYRRQPPFALFGIGPYSFAAFKVAVSGLHKVPRFRAIGPIGGRPAMLDDTCYFAACETAAEAALLVSLLSSTDCAAFFDAILFTDAKRPVTKRLLQRIDLGALKRRADRDELLRAADAEMQQLEPDLDDRLEMLSRTLDHLWNA